MPALLKRSVLIALCSLSLALGIPSAQAQTEEESGLAIGIVFELYQSLAQSITLLPGDCGKTPQKCTEEDLKQVLSKSLAESPMLMTIARDMPVEEMAKMLRYLATKAKPEQLKKFQVASETYAQAVKEFQKEVLGDQKSAMLKAMQGSQDKATLSSVKANMHTLQTIVETYGVDWGGEYAADVTMLKNEAEKSSYSYWKDFSNPFTGKTGIGKGGSLLDYKTYQNYKPHKDFAGLALYAPEKHQKGEPLYKYYIYGCDNEGKLIQNKGELFYLTNS